MPPDGPHLKALERWKASQVTFRRNTGGLDLSVAQFALYQMRFILVGDLADAWAEYNRIGPPSNVIRKSKRPRQRPNLSEQSPMVDTLSSVPAGTLEPTYPGFSAD